jgi:hypothetical protein
MSSSSRRVELRQLFGADTTAVVDTFGSGLRPYLPDALATPWHADRPPNYEAESKFAWTGRTDISTNHFTAPDTPLLLRPNENALVHFHLMISHIAASPGTVPEWADKWVHTGCTAVLCYVRCWDSGQKNYSDPLLTILSLPGFPLEPPDPPMSLWTETPSTTPSAPFDVDDGTTIIATAQASIPVADRPTTTSSTAKQSQYPKVWSGPELLADASTLYCLEGSRFFSLLAAPGLACESPTSLAPLTISSNAVPNGILPLALDSSGDPL